MERNAYMAITKFLQTAKRFDIQPYKQPGDFNKLKKENVAFTGAVMKHPYDPEKIVVLTDPLSASPVYYEFLLKDVSHVQETASVVDENGEAVSMSRVWVRKRSVGVRAAPFLVQDIRDMED